MSRLFRSSLLFTAASMVVGLLISPTAAHAADTTTKLSKAEMAAALKAMVTTTDASAKNGWRATLTVTGGSFGGSGSFRRRPGRRCRAQPVQLRRRKGDRVRRPSQGHVHLPD